MHNVKRTAQFQCVTSPCTHLCRDTRLRRQLEVRRKTAAEAHISCCTIHTADSLLSGFIQRAIAFSYPPCQLFLILPSSKKVTSVYYFKALMGRISREQKAPFYYHLIPGR